MAHCAGRTIHDLRHPRDFQSLNVVQLDGPAIVFLQTGETHYWMQPTLGDLEKRLDPRRFFRISRAAIVNLDAVREVAPVVGGYGEVRLSNDTRLEITRRRFKPLMDRLAE